MSEAEKAPAEAASAGGNGETSKRGKRRLYVGEDGVGVWRQGMEVDNIMLDGVCECPSLPLPDARNALRHGHVVVCRSVRTVKSDGFYLLHRVPRLGEMPGGELTRSARHRGRVGPLASHPAQAPLGGAERAPADAKAREQMAEMAFEGEKVPALYFGSTGVLSAYVSGLCLASALRCVCSPTSARVAGSQTMRKATCDRSARERRCRADGQVCSWQAYRARARRRIRQQQYGARRRRLRSARR